MSYLVLIVTFFFLSLLLSFLYIKFTSCIKNLEQKVELLKESIKDPLEKRIEGSEAIIRDIDRRLESLEKTFSSRSSGSAAEKIVENWLALLPPERIVKNVRLGKGIVEFALKLKNGSYVPIDSKFFHLEELKSSSELLQRVRERAKEISSYLMDERTVGLAIMAVPQGIFPFLRVSLFEELEKQGILIVSYEALLPVCHLISYFFEKDISLSQEEWTSFVKTLEKELFHLEKFTSQLLKEIKASETLALKIRESINYLQKALENLKN